jgi:hypothetical protein
MRGISDIYTRLDNPSRDASAAQSAVEAILAKKPKLEAFILAFVITYATNKGSLTVWSDRKNRAKCPFTVLKVTLDELSVAARIVSEQRIFWETASKDAKFAPEATWLRATADDEEAVEHEEVAGEIPANIYDSDTYAEL